MADAAKLVQKHLKNRLLDQFKTSVTYRSVAKPSYDPKDGVVTPGIQAEKALEVIVMPFSFTVTAAPQKQNDDQVILSVDRKCLFAALDLAPIVPKIGDEVRDSTQVWRVVGINDDPAPAHYNLHIRPHRVH